MSIFKREETSFLECLQYASYYTRARLILQKSYFIDEETKVQKRKLMSTCFTANSSRTSI